jgi:phosphate transport system substrate-binding protein
VNVMPRRERGLQQKILSARTPAPGAPTTIISEDWKMKGPFTLRRTIQCQQIRWILSFMAIAAVFLMTCGSLHAAQAAAASEVEKITGAGATFPMPIYAKWAARYFKVKGLKLAYQGIGSGGGIAQIRAKTVDFGASDRPLTAEDLEKDELIQFPMVIGGVVPVHNVEGVRKGRLKLTPELLTDIFMGKIKNWSDRRIKAVNSNLRLPDQEITVVHRADGSGTTWIFTTYLSRVSEQWKEKVGPGKAVSWPTGVGGKGNPGVAAFVKKIKGAIGYVEFAYALKNRLKYVKLQNQSGEFVKPTIGTFQKAAENADWANAPGFFMNLTDQPGKDTWPITGASYILIYKSQPEAPKAKAMLGFFDWCYRNGASMAKQLHYVPMPATVYKLVEALWKKDVTASGHPVWQ